MLGFGVTISFAAGVIPPVEPMRWPLFLAGGLLLMEGGFGLRSLPQLVAFGSSPDDWRRIERALYFGRIGKIRLAVAVLACVCLAVGGLALPAGDWQIWSIVVLMVVWALGCVFAAFKILRDVPEDDS